MNPLPQYPPPPQSNFAVTLQQREQLRRAQSCKVALEKSGSLGIRHALQNSGVWAFALTLLLFHSTEVASSADLGRIALSDDHEGFVDESTSQPFIPWGFNYDHDRDGRLIEDYWVTEWESIEHDFREMRELGANVIRVHLQFGRFMKSAEEPNAQSLQKLKQLVALAERESLYLDLTGLGCYHKADVPAWYDELDETRRWAAQAKFWEAIAAACTGSSAIFCYDLMNEPVVPGGEKPQDNWLGPAFGDKHFVQFITRNRAGRPRPEIAQAWIRQLVAAIRKHDQRTLVTVGLVPWSLDRPGLTSGFVPRQIAGELDFIAVHLYPEAGKLDEAHDTLKGFDVGKPVVIEEMFPLKCSAAELTDFIQQSRGAASGWIGFYWGATPEELAETKTIGAAITGQWLDLFQRERPGH
jgi:hypothetical protein